MFKSSIQLKQSTAVILGAGIVTIIIFLYVRLTQAVVTAYPSAGPLVISSFSSGSIEEKAGQVLHLGFGLTNQGSFPVTILDVSPQVVPGSPHGNDDLFVLDGVQILADIEVGLPATDMDIERLGIRHDNWPIILPRGKGLGGFFTVRYTQSKPPPTSLPAVYRLAVTYRYLGVTFHVTYPEVFAVAPVALPIGER